MLWEWAGDDEIAHDEAYYEKQVLSEPNNSFIWIHFISHMYKEEGIESARKVCERALKSIDMSQIKEKLNLWIAYMNLEYTFGQESKF